MYIPEKYRRLYRVIGYYFVYLPFVNTINE